MTLFTNAQLAQQLRLLAQVAEPEEATTMLEASERLCSAHETTTPLADVLRGLIDAVRSVNIERREWYTHIAQPLQDAYRALGSTGPGLTPEEIAALRDGSPLEPKALTPAQLGQAIADACEPAPLPHPLGCECRLCLPEKARARNCIHGKAPDESCTPCWMMGGKIYSSPQKAPGEQS